VAAWVILIGNLQRPDGMSDLSRKEREILVVMRKVLAQVIKDTTPPSRAMKHPLSEQTIQDVRHCLGLISLRERELADEAGIDRERPYYADEKPAAEVVSINRIGKANKETED
jgi:hypothetical protein